MKTTISAICIAAMCAVGLSAAQAQSNTSKNDRNNTWTKPVTLTGCLAAGVTAGTYQLTDVKGSRAGHHSAATGTSGTTTGATSTTAGTTSSTAGTTAEHVAGSDHAMTLVAEGTLDLTKEVGHEVQVTGRRMTKDSQHLTEGAGADQMSSGGAVSAGAQPTGGSTMTSGHGIGGGSGRALHVSSVTKISDSCSGSGK